MATPAWELRRLPGSEREAGSAGGCPGYRIRDHGAPFAGGCGRAPAVNRCQEREEPQRAGQVLGQAGKNQSERENAGRPQPLSSRVPRGPAW